MGDDLKDIRKKIDRIDSEFMRLLNERMELGLETAKFKDGPTDPKREYEVMQRVKQHAPDLIKGGFAEKLFSEIMNESRRLQSQKLALIGFQGEHGAYSEISAKMIPNAAPMPCMEFEEVFEGVKSGKLDLGVVPVENSLGGSVAQVNDLLVETDLNVIAEISVPIHHCLLVPPDTNYRDIKTVYSHPQALSQCRGFIQRNKLEPRPYYDTAGAARMIAADRPNGAAAIANSFCADLYGLDIIKENIEDSNSNTTRFFVLSKEKSKEKGAKCSLVFSTQHKAGALFSMLKIFADTGINLTRIESRPMRNDPGKFAFIVDFEGSDDDAKVVEALKQAKNEAEAFKFLGSYKVIK